MSPAEFTDAMEEIFNGLDEYGDHKSGTEGAHYNADSLLCAVLIDLGYEDGVKIFRSEDG